MVGYDCGYCDERLSIGNGRFGYEINPFPRGKLLFQKQGLLRHINHQQIALPIPRQQIILILTFRTQARHFMVNLNQGLGNIFLHFTLIIRVLFLFLNVVHGQLQLVDDGFVEDLVDEAVGLRQVVREVGGVGDLPGEEVGGGRHGWVGMDKGGWYLKGL